MELLTVESLLTLAGMTTLITLLTQIIKGYVADWRWTNLVAIGIGLVLGLVATGIVKGLSAETVLDAFLLALVAGMASSGLYETSVNLLAIAGRGPRAVAK